MFEYSVEIMDVEEVFALCNAMSRIPCSVDVRTEDGGYIVDAKSVLGVISLGVSRPLTLQAHTDDADVGRMIVDALMSFDAVNHGACEPEPCISVNSLAELEALIGRDTVERLFDEYSRHKKDADPDGLPSWLHTNPEVDISVGLDMCGSPEIYMETLKSFARHASDTIPFMWKALTSGNLDGVAIKAHSIKSSAAIVGAARLSELSKNTEAAASGGDIGKTREKLSEALDLYKEIAEWLLPLEAGDDVRRSGVMIEPDDIPALYKNLLAYVEDFNDEATGSMLDALKRYDFPPHERKRFEELLKAHEEADWELLQRLLSEALNG